MSNNVRYAVEFGAALAFYALLLVISLTVLVRWPIEGAFRIVVALVPMFGCLAVLAAVMRSVRRMDELARRVQFEAVAFAFVATALVTFGWGFVENVGAPRLPAFGVWPIMATFWCIGSIAASRRYR